MTMGVSLCHTTAGKLFQTASFDLDTQNSTYIRSSSESHTYSNLTHNLRVNAPVLIKLMTHLPLNNYCASHSCFLFLGFFICLLQKKNEGLDWMVSKVPSGLNIKFHGWNLNWSLSVVLPSSVHSGAVAMNLLKLALLPIYISSIKMTH